MLVQAVLGGGGRADPPLRLRPPRRAVARLDLAVQGERNAANLRTEIAAVGSEIAAARSDLQDEIAFGMGQVIGMLAPESVLEPSAPPPPPRPPSRSPRNPSPKSNERT